MTGPCPHTGVEPLRVCVNCGMVTPPSPASRPRTPRATRAAKRKAATPTVPAEEFTSVSFFVEGEPVTQGSMKAVGGGRLAHVSGPALTAWRTRIAAAARTAGATCVGDHEPVRVDCLFYLPRPKTVTRALPTGRKDTDKLMRAVGDALTGVAYADDVQVCDWNVAKRYATETIPAGVWVTVTLLTADDA
jgi:crossover junction endodeoxyribonuclease RusA